MPETNELMALLPALQMLERLEACMDMAGDLYAMHPGTAKDLIALKSPKPWATTVLDIAMLLSAVHPDELTEMRRDMSSAVRRVRVLVEDRASCSKVIGSERDVMLLRRWMSVALGSRSKRETERFLDAVEHGDTGTMTTRIDIHANGKRTVEVTFSSAN